MSAIAALYNVPSTPEELNEWAFAHAAHHADIIRVLYQKLGVNLDQYVLDPIPKESTGVWVYQHQIMHQQMDALLGIDGNDLSDVDFRDPNELAGWIYLNSSEHFQASNILGIG